MKQVFSSMPRCRIAMETGTHSPWVSRLLTALGHEVIVGHAQKVRLITKSRRKDDRLDARTLARLARIDIRRLPAVETLGSVSRICSDKTGTLTLMEMMVVSAVMEGVDPQYSSEQWDSVCFWWFVA
jgi:hypothetical protein